MLLYELYKVLSCDTLVSLHDSADNRIAYGYLFVLDVDILQSRVIYLTPISPQEILIKIDL